MRFPASVMLIALALLGVGVVGCGGDDDDGAAATSSSGPKQRVIGFVSPSPNDQFWVQNTKGANEAGVALKAKGVKVVVGVAKSSNDPSSMVPVIQNLLSQDLDAIVVPGHPQIVPAVRQATVPVIFYASGIPGSTVEKATVITDNLAAGRAAGEFLKEKMGGKGKLAILDILKGTYPLLDLRVQGVMEAIEGTDIKVVSQVNTNCETSKAVSAMQNVLTRTPDVGGVFGACSGAILGAEQAIKAAGRPAGSVVAVGFDGAAAEVAAIKAGKQDATVAQYPVKMGKTAIETAVAVLDGQQVNSNVDTGHALITKENADEFPDK